MANTPRHRPSCGRAGTATAYNRGCRCARCKTANTEAQREKRARRKTKAAAPHLTIVDDVPQASVPEVPSDADEPPSVGERQRRVRAMEKAVQDDIDEIDEGLRVPFHRSLSVLAIELAQEIDEPATAATARRDARKQLFEVLRSLRTQKEGDDDSALKVLLEERGFGTPLVSVGPA